MVCGSETVNACADARWPIEGLYTRRHRLLIDKGLSALLITSDHVTLVIWLSQDAPPPAVIADSGSGEKEEREGFQELFFLSCSLLHAAG